MITKEMLAETLRAAAHELHREDGCSECLMLKAAEECPQILRAIETAKRLSVYTALASGQSLSTEAMLTALKMGLILGRRLGMSEAMEALR